MTENSLLKQLLEDLCVDDPKVRRCTFNKINQLETLDKQILIALLNLLDSDSAAIRNDAGVVLAKAGKPIVPFLKEALPTSSPQQRKLLLWVLRRIDPGEKDIYSLIASYMDDPYTEVSEEAAYLFASIVGYEYDKGVDLRGKLFSKAVDIIKTNHGAQPLIRNLKKRNLI
jgi:hypothetical protein